MLRAPAWSILAVAAILSGCASNRLEHAEGAPLERLLDGNRRWQAGRASHPRADDRRRAEVAQSQRPFAVILTCADSRVPPELLFDQGLGDLFVVRVAGNVVSNEVLGSIEYAVEHLDSRLVLVLGHERCGAVQAALAAGAPGGHGSATAGHVADLVRAISPAIHGAGSSGEDALDSAVRANVRAVVERLRRAEPVLHARVDRHELEVAGARYDLDTGVVEVLGP